MKISSKCLALIVSFLPFLALGFQQEDSAQYVSQFSELTANAYAAVDDLREAPEGLDVCRNTGKQNAAGKVMLTEASPTVLSAADVQQRCGENNECVIGENVTVQIDGPLKLHALVVQHGGTVRWNDQTQTENELWLCAGFAVVEEGGKWDMDLQNASKRAWIYIMNNGATHNGLRTRAFGSYMAMDHMNSADADSDMMSHEAPHLSVIGRELGRTWSLLAEPLTPNSTLIKVIHNPIAMGWQVGDRLAVAPTESGMDDDAQDFFITAMRADGTITLDTASNDTSTHRAEHRWAGVAGAALRSAEVINLSRNIIITGDHFEELACDASLEEAGPGFGTSTQGCMCSGSRTSCTMGLHTASAHGGFSEVANVRVEKCGQRGVEGKYCLHFHHMMDCSAENSPNDSICISRNNAVEFSQQRGLIIHSTHHAAVNSNVFYDVRGANLYLEDGNEMLNKVAYNVGICPRGDNGCTLPGTSNGQGDTSLNQSGLYMESPNNLLIGNRMANFFNGMFNNAGNGRGPVEGEVCGERAPIGLWAGNTFHSNGRFGTYLLNGNFPTQNTGQSVMNNGTTNGDDECAAYDVMGDDMGLSSVILNHFDYGNVFVGQYGAGDIQYKNHVNIDNLNSIYWKETKTFEDGCSAHIADSYYEDGSADLPDAMGAFIIENTTFNDYGLRANHHCDVGVTGYLCMPHYVLHNVTWLDPRNTWVNFDINNGDTNEGGIFTLSPENIAAKENGASFNIFPQAYNALVGGTFEYLLNLPAENCTRSNDLGLGDRYRNGILCGTPLTALKIFTRNHSGGDLVLSVFDNESNQLLAQQRVPHLNITDSKQGYAMPVISGDTYRYEIALASGDDIDPNWVIDFGDLTVSNRWGVEHLHLEVQGRNCEGTIYSNHDRRFYAGGDFSDQMWGRGACTAFPSMPASDCSASPDLTQNQDAAYSPWKSQLEAVCSNVDCGENGVCAARYLGSDVPVLAAHQCVCKTGWYGANCESQDPDVQIQPEPDPEPNDEPQNDPDDEPDVEPDVALEPETEPESDGDNETDSGPNQQTGGNVTINGRFLLVDGAPYRIKGVAWNPVPKGGVHPVDLDFPGYADIDIPMMQDMGINTVRTYEPIVDLTVLDKLQAAGIKVINSAYSWGGNDVASVDAVVNAVKGHPAILMWSIGNEWNYNGLYFGLDFNTAAERVNAVAERIKTLDPNTPVATIYGELPSRDLVEQLNHVDVWAINAYRGISFGDLFEQWHSISDKPMFIGEYGADAYNANPDDNADDNDNGSGSGDVVGYDVESQNAALIALTQEIFDNIVSEDAGGNQRGVLGGTFFEWADEWWKAGNPDQQDSGGVAPGGGPFPDATFNEEYWGIVDIDRNPRCAFYNMKALYAALANNTTFVEASCDAVHQERLPEPMTPNDPVNDSAPESEAGDVDTHSDGASESRSQTESAAEPNAPNSSATSSTSASDDNAGAGGGSVSSRELITLLGFIMACRFRRQESKARTRISKRKYVKLTGFCSTEKSKWLRAKG